MEPSANNYKEQLKNEYAQKGFSSLSERQKLELILFYSLPAAVAIECAQSLLIRFGSFGGVFAATYESLCEVSKMTENAAAFIKLLPQVCAKYAQSKAADADLSSYESLKEFLAAEYFGLEHEAVKLICTNEDFEVLSVCAVLGNDASRVTVDARKIMSEVLASNCQSCILAHNHPCGNCAPSSEDYIVTEQITQLLASIDISLNDHVILGNDGVWSIQLRGKI